MLERSTDRKTANLANKAGKGAVIKNAFGLPSGTGFSCPGATGICETVCYAGKLERLFPNMRKVMLRNWEQVKDASYDQMYSLLSVMIAEFVADCDKRGAEKVFRIHHDGDFFSVEYAGAWAKVIRENEDVTFWAYTRSFTDKVNVIPYLVDLPNLAVYLSVDNENKGYATKILSDYPSVRVAALGMVWDEAQTITEEVRGNDKRVAKCPELTKALPLITTKGGACFSCGLCVNGRADVRFAVKR